MCVCVCVCLCVCVCARVCGVVHLCMAHAGCCNQGLLHRLGPARPPVATAGSAAPVCTLQQEAQHLEVASLSCVHQHTPTWAVNMAHLSTEGDKDLMQVLHQNTVKHRGDGKLYDGVLNWCQMFLVWIAGHQDNDTVPLTSLN